MLSSQMCKDTLSEECIKAIEKFQCTMIEKEPYLAFHLRKQFQCLSYFQSPNDVKKGKQIRSHPGPVT